MKKQHHSPRGRNTLITTLVALGLSWGSSQLSWAEPGALTQLDAPHGCIAEVGNGIDCTDGFGLANAEDVTVSPDGKHVYVASLGTDAITAFARNKTTGELTPAGCVSDTGSGGACTNGSALRNPTAVAVSPDGKHLYVASNLDSAVVALARNKTTGALTPAGCISDTGSGGACSDGIGLEAAWNVTVSPDGKHVYVASALASSVTAFTRDKTTGALTQLPAPTGCISATGDGGLCSAGFGLLSPWSVAVSKDGKHVYVASAFNGFLAIFTRNTTTGALTQLPLPAGCLNEFGQDGCGFALGLNGARSMVVSGDGKHVYVAAFSDSTVAIFARNKTTGALTQLPTPLGCVSDDGSGGACENVIGLKGARSVTVSKDGKHVYVASETSNAVTTFARDKTTGVLTQLPTPEGCTAELGNGFSCIDGVGLDSPAAVAVSKDGKHVYVASEVSNAVTVFAREQ